METLTAQTTIPACPGQIEILNRSGAVIRRLPLTSGILTLGRDLTSDLILDDPYVCPHHARLYEREGRLVIEDLGSVNGVSRAPGGIRIDHLEIESGESLRVGHTTLRYRNATSPLPPTLVDRSGAGPLRQLERPRFLAVLYLFAPLLLLLTTYLETTTRLEVDKLLLTPIIAVLILLLWAALWAFANRILSYRWHFAIHLGIGCAGLISMQLWETLNGYLSFALNLDYAYGALEHLGQTLLVAILIFAHLRFVSFAPSRSLARAAGIISLTVLGISLLPAVSERGDFNPAPAFQVTLKSPLFNFVPRKNADLFFKEIEKMPAELAQPPSGSKE